MLFRRLFSLSISNFALLSPMTWPPQLHFFGFTESDSVCEFGSVFETIFVLNNVGLSGVDSASIEALMLSAYTLSRECHGRWERASKGEKERIGKVMSSGWRGGGVRGVALNLKPRLLPGYDQGIKIMKQIANEPVRVLREVQTEDFEWHVVVVELVIAKRHIHVECEVLSIFKQHPLVSGNVTDQT